MSERIYTTTCALLHIKSHNTATFRASPADALLPFLTAILRRAPPKSPQPTLKIRIMGRKSRIVDNKKQGRVVA
jgi:hypothetical protein